LVDYKRAIDAVLRATAILDTGLFETVVGWSAGFLSLLQELELTQQQATLAAAFAADLSEAIIRLGGNSS
jgi:hypothetical protein